MRYVIQPDDEVSTDRLGGKARALHALNKSGLLIPAWFALAPEAFYASTDLAQFLAAPGQTKLAPQVQAELSAALACLCPNNEPVAVRSSALDEDGEQHSFAGQLDSFLLVAPQEVAGKVVAVWRSAFNERGLVYRRENGLEQPPQAPAVLIQHMINSEMSGVAFSADPVNGRQDITVIGAVRGLGDALVSGKVNADTYRVDYQGQVLENLPAGQQAVLNEMQIREVASLVRRAEAFFGCPQDVEWAIESNQLYLLQARPITTLAKRPTDDIFNLWDNSNIAESYPGLTTPLTFSFARRAYEEVYRQFCRMMGVPAATIKLNAMTFRRMLGLCQGRLYYNLLSWYRVLAMLPGYKLNRGFMEQMMGVKESLPEALLSQVQSPQSSRFLDVLYVLRTLAGLVVNFIFLPGRIRAFYLRLNQALGGGRPDLSGHRPEELVAHYRDLETRLLTRWDAPLINDFFAMIFYGLLSGLTRKWCADTNGTLQNNLLAATGGIISAEPIIHIRKMARIATADPKFVDLLCEGTLAEILPALPNLPDFETHYRAYLEKFGDRCLEELKLENPTLHDDPQTLLRSVGQFARKLASEPARLSPETAQTNQVAIAAEAQVRQALARHPLRKLVFQWVLKNARDLVRNRENLRFERTRLFGRARMIFVELGRRFQAAGLLADPRDIFYLEVEEILGTVDGTTTTADLNGLVRVRRAEFDNYRVSVAPPDRFETRGIPAGGLQARFSKQKPTLATPTGETLQGLGCSSGILCGRVRVVTDPKNAVLEAGEILVADHTDPGWILLFSSAAGLLVEHGSLLSHAAIVSREMGLPCIVSLPGVTHWLKDGDWVEFDGGTGLVRKLENQIGNTNAD